MTLARKERIERVAAQWWAAYIASPTQSPWTHNDCIAEASKFIDTIDALPAEPDDEVSQAKRILGVRPDAPLVGSLLNFVHQRTKDAMLAREANRAKAPARAPDTTMIERERCAAVAKKHLCISGNKFAQDAARSILSEIINPSLDGPLNRQPDHIEEINKLVDDVFGKHDNAQ
jgi:hypothetical protein